MTVPGKRLLLTRARAARKAAGGSACGPGPLPPRADTWQSLFNTEGLSPGAQGSNGGSPTPGGPWPPGLSPPTSRRRELPRHKPRFSVS